MGHSYTYGRYYDDDDDCYTWSTTIGAYIFYGFCGLFFLACAFSFMWYVFVVLPRRRAETTTTVQQTPGEAAPAYNNGAYAPVQAVVAQPVVATAIPYAGAMGVKTQEAGAYAPPAYPGAGNASYT